MGFNMSGFTPFTKKEDYPSDKSIMDRIKALQEKLAKAKYHRGRADIQEQINKLKDMLYRDDNRG